MTASVKCIGSFGRIPEWTVAERPRHRSAMVHGCAALTENGELESISSLKSRIRVDRLSSSSHAATADVHIVMQKGRQGDSFPVNEIALHRYVAHTHELSRMTVPF